MNDLVPGEEHGGYDGSDYHLCITHDFPLAFVMIHCFQHIFCYIIYGDGFVFHLFSPLANVYVLFTKEDYILFLGLEKDLENIN